MSCPWRVGVQCRALLVSQQQKLVLDSSAASPCALFSGCIMSTDEELKGNYGLAQLKKEIF